MPNCLDCCDANLQAAETPATAGDSGGERSGGEEAKPRSGEAAAQQPAPSEATAPARPPTRPPAGVCGSVSSSYTWGARTPIKAGRGSRERRGREAPRGRSPPAAKRTTAAWAGGAEPEQVLAATASSSPPRSNGSAMLACSSSLPLCKSVSPSRREGKPTRPNLRGREGAPTRRRCVRSINSRRPPDHRPTIARPSPGHRPTTSRLLIHRITNTLPPL